MFAVWPREAFSSMGEFSTYEGRSFCDTCGSSLQFLFDGVPDMMWIAAGTFDGVPDRRPEAHIFVGSKAPWHDITDDLPCHEEYPPRH